MHIAHLPAVSARVINRAEDERLVVRRWRRPDRCLRWWEPRRQEDAVDDDDDAVAGDEGVAVMVNVALPRVCFASTVGHASPVLPVAGQV